MIIAFDLDRVFINYPPFVPYKLIDWLYRDNTARNLSYRIPRYPWEKKLREMTHYHLFRPKITPSIRYLQTLSQHHPHHQLYLVSSRYQFLEDLTYKILRRYGIFSLFKGIHLNLKNEQPHLYKERVIRDLGAKIFIDDDLDLLRYLQDKCPNTKLLWYNPGNRRRFQNGITSILSLDEVEKYL